MIAAGYRWRPGFRPGLVEGYRPGHRAVIFQVTPQNYQAIDRLSIALVTAMDYFWPYFSRALRPKAP